MSGYTPVFASVFDGTLHGRWPHTGIWVCLLAMADKHGCIDKVPRAIAADIGVELDTLLTCLADFCAPDPDSRSAESDGRRLELIDAGRPWGWRIINHGKYREKARLDAQNARQVADGRNAEKVRRYKERQKEKDTAGHPQTPTDTLSNTNTNTNSEKVPTEPVAPKRDAVAEVFEHWKLVHGHPQSRLDDRRRRLIRAALANYTADQLCEAISGYLNSPHHMGQNDRATKYDAIELFLRDAKHIDAGLRFSREPPSTFSKTTRQNIANTAGWVPPEVRNAAG